MLQQRVQPGRPPPPLQRDLGIEIVRPRLLAMLAQHATTPVRILCAPHGGGKTTALVQYATAQPAATLVTLPLHASREQVLRCLAGAAASAEIVVDRADAASSGGRAALFERIEAGPLDGQRYLLGGSSRNRMHAQPLVARGIATLIDGSALAFTADEIRALAHAQSVACDEMDVEQLKYDTDGWPVAVAWIVRDAARNGRALRGAFEQWREGNGHLLTELVTLAHADDASATTFAAAIRSWADPASQRALELLDAEGYPIVRMRSGLRPYRVLMRLGDQPDTARSECEGGRLVLKLFGRFDCRIANHPVAFDRRRDQNVLTYIALAPDATVTRTELLAAFWPEASRAVASQGLRTTLCRLRRAVADAAGCDAARYVSVDNSIALDLDWVSVDARLFRDHVALAEREDDDGNASAARDHYLQAERLYIGALLASEAMEPQLRPRAAEFDDLFKLVRARNALGYRASRRAVGDLQP